MAFSTSYTLGFASAICVVCSIFVAGSAVALKDKQDENARADEQKQVLIVAGLMKPDEKIENKEVAKRFEANFRPRIIDLKTGTYDDKVDPASFNMAKAMSDPATSQAAPENPAKVQRLPKHGRVYQLVDKGVVKMLILPVEGKGLWSTLKGYLALAPDTTRIEGLTFYAHAETPGLGGEVDNPRWKALWKDRRAFDAAWKPQISVVKGQAGPAKDDPHRVDGLSGATLTSRGVTHLLQFWLGEHGFGPYLAHFRKDGT